MYLPTWLLWVWCLKCTVSLERGAYFWRAIKGSRHSQIVWRVSWTSLADNSSFPVFGNGIVASLWFLRDALSLQVCPWNIYIYILIYTLCNKKNNIFQVFLMPLIFFPLSPSTYFLPPVSLTFLPFSPSWLLNPSIPLFHTLFTPRSLLTFWFQWLLHHIYSHLKIWC